ncbi:gypsy retrotransposon integrase 1-like protein, partial [Clarias magur]
MDCFMKGHRSTVCSRSWVCKVPGCGKSHNTWLHSAIVASNNDKGQFTNQAGEDEPAIDPPPVIQSHVTRKCIEVSQRKIALPILPVVVSDKHKQFSMKVFALLDSGSNGTFASKKLVHGLKLESHKINIKLNTMETKNLNVVTIAVDLQVEDAQQRNSFLIKGVLCRDHLNIGLDNLVTQKEVLQWPHLQEIVDEISFPDADLADEVHLLIGLDQPDILAPRDTCCGESGEPYAILTGLGWILHGPIADGSTYVSANFIQTDHSLQQAVERFWKLDDPVHVNNDSLSVVDEQVVTLWNKQAVKEE